MIYRKVKSKFWVLITRRIFLSFFVSSFFFFLLYLYEKIDVSWTYCGNHFTIYVIQIIMLYALSLYADVYILFFNKTEKPSKILSRAGACLATVSHCVWVICTICQVLWVGTSWLQPNTGFNVLRPFQMKLSILSCENGYTLKI